MITDLNYILLSWGQSDFRHTHCAHGLAFTPLFYAPGVRGPPAMHGTLPNCPAFHRFLRHAARHAVVCVLYLGTVLS